MAREHSCQRHTRRIWWSGCACRRTGDAVPHVKLQLLVPDLEQADLQVGLQIALVSEEHSCSSFEFGAPLRTSEGPCAEEAARPHQMPRAPYRCVRARVRRNQREGSHGTSRTTHTGYSPSYNRSPDLLFSAHGAACRAARGSAPSAIGGKRSRYMVYAVAVPRKDPTVTSSQWCQ